jgi:hypothetical protein
MLADKKGVGTMVQFEGRIWGDTHTGLLYKPMFSTVGQAELRRRDVFTILRVVSGQPHPIDAPTFARHGGPIR